MNDEAERERCLDIAIGIKYFIDGEKEIERGGVEEQRVMQKR